MPSINIGGDSITVKEESVTPDRTSIDGKGMTIIGGRTQIDAKGASITASGRIIIGAGELSER